MVMKNYEVGPPTALAEPCNNMYIMYDGSGRHICDPGSTGEMQDWVYYTTLGHNQAFSVALIFTVPRWGISVFLKTEP